MRLACIGAAVSLVASVLIVPVSSQTQSSGAAATTDIYHVNFSKAVPGEAAALGTALAVPDKTAPMPDHFVVLRHQEGDDWDYVVIQHLGQKFTLDASPTPVPAASKLRAWHNDSFVVGPSWAEFTKAMGIGAAGAANAVYTVGVHRPVPGHREQLLTALTAPAPSAGKVQTGNIVFQHMEGSDWVFLTITRYDSWQDFATDRAAAASGTAGGWADVRQHSAFHRDTIADRIHPR
jgi:hypothetical protein